MLPLFERYVLRRVTYIFLLTLGALIATLWVTQVLREIDVVTARGQAMWVFFLMTVLALPSLTQLIAPIAFLAATILCLNSLASDSELPVIAAAGASRRAVNRPILILGVLVMIAIAASHHLLAPASLSTLRAILTRVRIDVIATLVQDGGFRAVDDKLTMHIREKAADGSFRGIFVDDQRDPRDSLQYSAANGVLIEQAGGSYLVLQDGDLIREDRTTGESNIVAFETYALALSQLGGATGAEIYKARERSTFYLMDPAPDDAAAQASAREVVAELHHRTTAPLYALTFAFVALAFLGRPRANRQDRSFAIAAVILICAILRAGGFAAWAAARNLESAIPTLYAIPLAGLAFGAWATMTETRLRIPRSVEATWDATVLALAPLLRRFAGPSPATGSERS